MRKAGMPNPESSVGNFVAAGGRLEEDQGRGESLISWRITVPSSSPFSFEKIH